MENQASVGLSSAGQSASAPAGHPFGLPSIIWFFALLAICNAPILYQLVNHWMVDEDMSHGFFVPVVAGYVAYQRREDLYRAPLNSSPLGLVLVVLGASMALAGTLGAELFISRAGFVSGLVGCILFLGGMPAIRVLAFPLFLLLFMIPIPAIIYNQITFPLQLIASGVAEISLGFVGIPVLRDGNVLELPSQRLSVVEACSGIRSLMSLSFLSLVYGCFFDNKPWMRWALLGAIVPIAITANSSRVTLTGILSEINPEFASGVYHSLSGWVVFVVAMAMMLVAHQIINRVHALTARSDPGSKAATQGA